MTREEIAALRVRIAMTRFVERPKLDREWQRLRSHAAAGRDFTEAWHKLAQRIDASVAQIEALHAVPLKFEYDPELPITAHRDEFLTALASHQVLILCGATGSGKSTQLPKLCIEAGRGLYGLVGHTQPRRIAARALANRLAAELETVVGATVGYQVRFTDHTGPQTRVKLMTDGILLREMEADRDLRRYDTLIIDEAHERSLNIDLILGMMKQVLSRRPDLKLIITSATIDPKKFSDYFGGAPIIEVSGRSYPVEVRYRPLISDDEESIELSLPEGVLAAVEELEHSAPGLGGDVLVFLPGEKQIREAAKVLHDAHLKSTEILPLYARLSVGDQEKIFSKHTGRRIVLATNVAETSLTVPGIRHVIDSGLARISRYSVRNKVQRLPIEKIAKANADQRKGRCGRVAEGICIRLYDEVDFASRDEFTAPELLRTNQASIILKLAMMGLSDPLSFPFVDTPELKAINDGYRLLQELKAVDANRHITGLGKQIAILPLDPRLARMLIAAGQHHCLREMLVVAAFLSIQDPRERPQEAQQKADQHHASYADARSDFMTVVTLWKRYHQMIETVSGNQLRKWCREEFLSFIRMREWQEVHGQLREAIDELGLKANQMDPSFSDFHQAILCGFLGGIGTLDVNREYLGARSTRFVIAPGTPLASKPPQWVVAASLVETNRMYARMVAAIEPEWIESVAAHLLKRIYSEPTWEARRGFVSALQNTSLYGLVLSVGRRINYASVAPLEARQLFVRHALVEGNIDLRSDFLDHNRAIIKKVEALEAKIRRRDLLITEQGQVDFYLCHLPEHIHSTTALKGWMREQRLALQSLRMTLEDIAQTDLSAFDLKNYPEHVVVGDNQLQLRYKFDPADEDDGVTVLVPTPLLTSLNYSQLCWCVPGWHLERITEVLRALPKSLRKAFLPVPKFAEQALQEVQSQLDISLALTQWITKTSGVVFTLDQLNSLTIPSYLNPYFSIEDTNARVISRGRDFRSLIRQGQQLAAASDAVLSITVSPEQQYRAWTFGLLPESREVQRQAVRYSVYPAILDQHDHVKLVEFNNLIHAEQVTLKGVLRLLILVLPQQYKFARQQFSSHRELMLLGHGLSGNHSLADGLSERAFRECFLAEQQVLPRSGDDFNRLIELHRSELNTTVMKMTENMLSLFKDHHKVNQCISTLNAPSFAPAKADIQQQLLGLLSAGFLQDLSQPWFGYLPRYIKALARRVDKLSANLQRDLTLMQQVQPFLTGYQQLVSLKPLVQVELTKLKWMIEEFRVSLFAQELKASMPVSAKRLTEQLERAKKEAG